VAFLSCNAIGRVRQTLFANFLTFYNWRLAVKNKLADLSLELVERFRKLNQGELVSIIAECERVNHTNCWWASYWCAPLFRQLAADCLTIPRPAEIVEVKKSANNSRSNPCG
jgi:hypothetical protein